MDKLLAWHIQRYPLMESRDKVKLIFQAMLGCGHLLGSHEQVTARIAGEMESLRPDANEPLTEPAGPDYMRVNLRRAKAEGIRPEWLAQLMLESTPPRYTREEAASAAASLQDEEAQRLAAMLVEQPDWLPSHTAAYHAAYHPAYRIVSRDLGKALQALLPLAANWQKERILMLIDGPCGSGKSTLAGQLQRVVDAAVIPMDDFFLPHPQKTPERLALPGGNADWERLCLEVLPDWLQGRDVSYRPYLCHRGCMGDPAVVPHKKVTIIEGSYAMMPEIRKHSDVQVFLTVAEDVQIERILARNGPAMLEMFRSRWIPLEAAYFAAFSLPDAGCLVLHGDQEE